MGGRDGWDASKSSFCHQSREARQGATSTINCNTAKELGRTTSHFQSDYLLGTKFIFGGDKISFFLGTTDVFSKTKNQAPCGSEFSPEYDQICSMQIGSHSHTSQKVNWPFRDIEFLL